MIFVLILLIILAGCIALRFSMKHHFRQTIVRKLGYPEDFRYMMLMRVIGYGLLFVALCLAVYSVNSLVFGLMVFFGILTPCIYSIAITVHYTLEAK